MADATGHRDRPNAGPLNSAQIRMNGILTNYYWYQNESSHRYEVVRAMPAGTGDVVVKEFTNMLDLQNWVNEEWNRGGNLG
jgi:hypothetical protein